MSLKTRMIIEDFRASREDFIKLGSMVHAKLREIVDETGIVILGIEHRVKTEKSLEGKLERNADWYNTMDDLTDLLGARIICFFADEVDIIGERVEQSFVIDRENSSDKRALIKADTFGYLSLHYICSVTEEMGYPPEVCGKKFEIQIRTNLQHTWAAICHDLGYKSEFGVPRVVTRQFARLAGLLELADDEFVSIRNVMEEYTEEIRQKIMNDCADDVRIDMISLDEYMKSNRRMREFIAELAAISNAEISEVNPQAYTEQLAWLNIRTIGDLQKMLMDNRELALELARSSLENTDLDILASNVGLRYLCRAKLLNDGYGVDEAAQFIKISTGDLEKAKRQAKFLYASHGGSKE